MEKTQIKTTPKIQGVTMQTMILKLNLMGIDIKTFYSHRLKISSIENESFSATDRAQEMAREKVKELYRFYFLGGK